jgi:hypothetical protein
MLDGHHAGGTGDHGGREQPGHGEQGGDTEEAGGQRTLQTGGQARGYGVVYASGGTRDGAPRPAP